MHKFALILLRNTYSCCRIDIDRINMQKRIKRMPITRAMLGGHCS